MTSRGAAVIAFIKLLVSRGAAERHGTGITFSARAAAQEEEHCVKRCVHKRVRDVRPRFPDTVGLQGNDNSVPGVFHTHILGGAERLDAGDALGRFHEVAGVYG